MSYIHELSANVSWHLLKVFFFFVEIHENIHHIYMSCRQTSADIFWTLYTSLWERVETSVPVYSTSIYRGIHPFIEAYIVGESGNVCAYTHALMKVCACTHARMTHLHTVAYAYVWHTCTQSRMHTYDTHDTPAHSHVCIPAARAHGLFSVFKKQNIQNINTKYK